MGLIVNVLIRLSILYFLGEVLLFPDDPRFAGKAIPIRNLIIVLSLTLLFPLFYFLKKRWKRYPFWFDNLYLSIFWLDMAGNSLNLYDSYFFFDLIPHFHGTGAFSKVIAGTFGYSAVMAAVFANVVHILLEGQEIFTDVFFGTHNVRGAFDTVNDILVGILGSIFYIFLLPKIRLTQRMKYMFLLLIVFVIGGMIFHKTIATHTKALLFLSQEFSYIPIKPLDILSKSPIQRKVELSAGDEKIVADLFVPTLWFETVKKPVFPAVIVAMGVRTQEKDKPIVHNLANTLSRLGYVVLWPRREVLDKGVASYEKPETFIAGFDYLETLDVVDKKRISYIGFSVGSSIALLAAGSEAIADSVHGLVFFGGYYDIFDYLTSLETGTMNLDGKQIKWEPAEGAISHVKEILKEQKVEWASTTEKERAILENLNPRQNLQNFKALVFILHDRNDKYVPYVESIKLYEALPKERVGSYALIDLFEHVQPKDSFSFAKVLELLKLYQFLYASLRHL